MKPSPPNRFGLLSGVLFVVLVIVGFAVLGGTDTPELKDSAQKVSKFYTDDSSNQQAAAFVVAIAAVFLAIFAAHVVAALHSAGVSSAWSALVGIGGTVAVAGLLLMAGIHLTLAEAADKGFNPDQLRVLNALDGDTWPMAMGGFAIFIIGSGAALLKSGLVPKWFAWISIVLGILTITPIGWFAFLLSLIWVVAESILLFIRLSSGKSSSPGKAAA